MTSQKRLIDTVPDGERTKPMEILALGFSRTGTMSLKVALEKLGYSVYHMSECITRWQEQHLQLWEEALNAKLKGQGKPWTGRDIDKILRNYDVIEDIPCLLFIDELLEEYPNAKVILTNRDIDSWYISVNQSFFKILEWRTLPWIAFIDPILWGPYYTILRMIVTKWTGGDMSNGEALRRSYIEHYTYVRSRIPSDRLLEFESKDGWAPLCNFLGKPVPKDESYPRINDARWTVQIHKFIYYLRLWHCTRKYVGAVSVVLIAVGIGYWTLSI